MHLQVVPTTGQTSTSIWDVTDLAFFSEWLGQSLGPGVTHSVMEVCESSCEDGCFAERVSAVLDCGAVFDWTDGACQASTDGREGQKPTGSHIDLDKDGSLESRRTGKEALSPMSEQRCCVAVD